MGTCRSRRICWHLDRDIERDLTGGPSDIESNASVIATDRRACCVRGSVADHAADRRDAAASAAVVIGLMQPAGRRYSDLERDGTLTPRPNSGDQDSDQY